MIENGINTGEFVEMTYEDFVALTKHRVLMREKALKEYPDEILDVDEEYEEFVNLVKSVRGGGK